VTVHWLKDAPLRLELRAPEKSACLPSSFVDELAVAARRDSFEFRRETWDPVGWRC
jgi:hypothetical protein